MLQWGQWEGLECEHFFINFPPIFPPIFPLISPILHRFLQIFSTVFELIIFVVGNTIHVLVFLYSLKYDCVLCSPLETVCVLKLSGCCKGVKLQRWIYFLQPPRQPKPNLTGRRGGLNYFNTLIDSRIVFWKKKHFWLSNCFRIVFWTWENILDVGCYALDEINSNEKRENKIRKTLERFEAMLFALAERNKEKLRQKEEEETC